MSRIISFFRLKFFLYKTCKEQQAEIQTLRAQLAEALQVIRFYGDDDMSWKKDKVLRQGRMIYMPKNQMSLIGYEMAKRFLKKVGYGKDFPKG